MKKLLDELGNETFTSQDIYEQWRGHLRHTLGQALEECSEDCGCGTVFTDFGLNGKVYERVERYYGLAGALPTIA